MDHYYIWGFCQVFSIAQAPGDNQASQERTTPHEGEEHYIRSPQDRGDT